MFQKKQEYFKTQPEVKNAFAMKSSKDISINFKKSTVIQQEGMISKKAKKKYTEKNSL